MEITDFLWMSEVHLETPKTWLESDFRQKLLRQRSANPEVSVILWLWKNTSAPQWGKIYLAYLVRSQSIIKRLGAETWNINHWGIQLLPCSLPHPLVVFLYNLGSASLWMIPYNKGWALLHKLTSMKSCTGIPIGQFDLRNLSLRHCSQGTLDQLFSTLLKLQMFNTVPHVVMSHNCKIIFVVPSLL